MMRFIRSMVRTILKSRARAHPQPHVDVAALESGREAVPRDVGDRQTQDLLGHRDVVEEVAADALHRLRAAARSKSP